MKDRKVGVTAERLGIDEGYLSQVTNCHRGVSLALALDIAAHFETTVEVLASAPVEEESAHAGTR